MSKECSPSRLINLIQFGFSLLQMTMVACRLLALAAMPAIASASPDASSSKVTESILYSFEGYLAGGTDGIGPNGVMFAKDGNLYGTTGNGGAYNGFSCGYSNGDGTFFRVTPWGPFAASRRAGGFPHTVILLSWAPSERS